MNCETGNNEDLLNGEELSNQERRQFLRILGAGALGLGLTSCSEAGAMAGIGGAALGVDAASQKLFGKPLMNDDTKKWVAVATVVFTAIYVYNLTQRQKSYVSSRQTSLKKASTKYSVKSRYVATTVPKPKTQVKKKRPLSIASITKKGNPTPKSTRHMVVYDTQNKSVVNNKVYEVDASKSVKSGQAVTVGGKKAVYASV